MRAWVGQDFNDVNFDAHYGTGHRVPPKLTETRVFAKKEIAEQWRNDAADFHFRQLYECEVEE